MSIKFQIYNQNSTHFLTFTIVDWVDIFTRRVYKDIVMSSLDYCIRSKGLIVFGYVIMSNHVHVIVQGGGAILLSDIVRDLKKFTAKKILEFVKNGPESRKEWILHRFRFNASLHQRNSTFQVWTHENHAEEISSLASFEKKLNYIHQNPVRSGLVSFEEDYIYSSAFELAGRGSKLEVSRWQ